MEERLRNLENKFVAYEATLRNSIKWIAVIGIIILSFLGYSTWFELPKVVKAELSADLATSLRKDIKELHDSAQKDAAFLRQFSQKGENITVDETCFRPRKLFWCSYYKQFELANDSNTSWVENAGECAGEGFSIKKELWFLVEC